MCWWWFWLQRETRDDDDLCMMMMLWWWWCYDDDDVMMMSSYSDVNFFGICENPYQNKKMWVFQWDWKKIKWDCDVLLPSLI